MSQAKKSQGVLYIDGLGLTHTAIVTSVNAAHEGYISLVYVDVNAPEPDNVKKIFDVPHVDDPSREEKNPELPSYEVNCWKFVGEYHSPLPSDHPGFDHPFEPQKKDELGNVIPKKRPQTEADLREHQRWPMSTTAIADESGTTDTAASAPAAMSLPSWTTLEHSIERVAAFLASKGQVVADVLKFLNDLRAHEAKHFREDFAKWAEQNPAPTPLPTPAADEPEPPSQPDMTGAPAGPSDPTAPQGEQTSAPPAEEGQPE